MKRVLILLTIAIGLLGAETPIHTGQFSLYLMKDGKPLAQQPVMIYKKQDVATIGRTGEYDKHAEFKTDADGSVYTVLPVGTYQMQLVAKHEGIPQAYVKKGFTITAKKESQLIVSLKSDDTLAFADLEASQSVQEDANATQKAVKEKGEVQLQLISSEDKKSVKDARVFVKGMSLDLKSDANGIVMLTLPEGKQTISIIHNAYSSQTMTVTVLPKETVIKSVELTPASMELEEFVVLAPHVEGSLASLVAEKKNTSSIADIVGSDEMSKKGDSNAAAALKRVSGITLVDGQNIYVRGLGERYSNVELNSMHLPSPNPTKRVVPLNIFPSSVIGSLKVQKSFSPDIPGNFAGGYIDIRTKEDVSEDYVKLSLAVKAHDTALNGTQGNFYDGGGSDWTGYDDGTRAIPDSVLGPGQVVVGQKPPSFSPYATDTDGNRLFTQEQLIQMTKDMAGRSYDTHKSDIPLGGKGTIELSKKIDIDDKQSIGILANYSYDTESKYIKEQYYEYKIDGQGDISDTPENEGVNERTITTIKHGGMLNLSYNYDDIFKIKYTKLYLLNTSDRTRVTDGTIGSNSDLQRLYSLDWEERVLNTDQITGSWLFDAYVEQQFDFGVQWSTASLDQPNNLRYDYIDYSGTGDEYILKTQSAQNLINHNLTSDDDVKSLYLRDTADIDLLSEDDRLDFGVSVTQKTRESRSNKYFMDAANQTMDRDDLSNSPDYILDKYVTNSDAGYYDMGLLVKTLFQPSDYYDADLDQTGLYVKALLNPTDKFEFTLGVRKEDLTQTLYEYGTDSSTGLVNITENSLVVDKWLPSFETKYKFTDNDQLRFAFSQTYVYPDFREFSSSGYFHPDEVATVVGNPDLVSTDITNYDLRYEHYFSPTESLSGAVFYKYMDNPIEDVSRPTTSLPIYSYENTDEAVLYGFEVDGIKNLDFIDDRMEQFYFAGNFSYTYSEVSLSEEQQERFTSNKRDLQGLSPMVINASIGYDNTEGRSINLAYNLMSERLRKVGLKNGVQEYPDQYETPPNLVDFTWQERLMEGVDMKFKARNLLNEEIVWTEDSRVTKQYKLGRSYEIGVSYRY